MVLLIALALLFTPLPPVGFQMIESSNVVSILWSQQSDANVVCFEPLYHGASRSLGCAESLAGPRAATFPRAPSGTAFFLHEWRRSPDNTWTSYGIYSAGVVPYHVLLPVISSMSP